MAKMTNSTHHRCVLWFALAVLVTCSVPLLGDDGVGAIRGAVMTDRGDPVAGAYVTAVPTFDPKNPAKPSRNLTADSSGGFFIESLEPGQYQLCAQKNDGDLVNGCSWSEELLTVEVGQGQTVRDVRLELQHGVRLSIRVDDPGQALTNDKAQAGNAHFSVGVFSPQGLYHAIPERGKDQKGRTHWLTVPPETPLRLAIEAHNVTVEDETGKQVQKNDMTSVFTAELGQTEKQFTFSVREKP